MKPLETGRELLSLMGLVLGLLATFGVAHAQASEGDNFHDKLMQLGSGSLGGSFLPIGNTLCETLNAARKTTLVRCVPEYSAGSVFNIHAVANGALQLGLSQEDLLAELYGDSAVRRGAQLRTVALLHNSPIAIMVRKAVGITGLPQIRKGVMNLGNKGAGDYANAMALLKVMNLRETDFAGVTYLRPDASVKAFCEGKVDIVINALAHPSPMYQQLRGCGGEFLNIPHDVIKKMIQENRWLKPMSIPAGMYDPEQAEVKTLGMRNFLFTQEGVDAEAIFRVATLLISQYKNLQTSQPNLSSMVLLGPNDINGLAVPLHQGALRALQRRVP